MGLGISNNAIIINIEGRPSVIRAVDTAGGAMGIWAGAMDTAAGMCRMAAMGG